MDKFVKIFLTADKKATQIIKLHEDSEDTPKDFGNVSDPVNTVRPINYGFQVFGNTKRDRRRENVRS